MNTPARYSRWMPYWFTALCLGVALFGATPARASFVHPGGLHTQADLDRMKTQVAAGAHPWIDGWNNLISDSLAQNNYTAAPQANMGVSRQRADKDAHAAYLNAIRWYISGDVSYADCAVRILNGWSAAVNQVPTGTDIPGLSGIPIMDFALAAEVLRIFPGWAAADQAKFKNMMTAYFYPVCHDFLVNHNGTCISHYWANWDICNLGALIAMGVLCDNQAIYDEGVAYFQSGAGNGCIMNAVYYLHPGGLGQWQESGRDQSHGQLGIGMLGYACQVAWNQGLDLFGYSSNRLLAGTEYVAQSTVRAGGVPYQPYNNCDNVNQYYLANNALGAYGDRPVYELLYNHYAVRKGLSAPNTKAMAQVMRPERGSIDHFGYGTLTFTLDAAASSYPASPVAPAPTDLTATPGIGLVVLKWSPSGAYSAQGYQVLRATTSGGPYTSIASWTNNASAQYTDTTVTNGTTYYYVVAAINQAGTSANSAQASATPAASGALPADWSDQDIGSPTVVGSAGYASVSNNSYVVVGEGAGIGGTSDSFHYAYKTVTGNYTVTARLWSLGGVKSGVMMRESVNPDAPALMMKVGDVGWREAGFGTRSTTAGSMTWVGGNAYSWRPVWFRLQRVGNTFTASQSSDGMTWFTVGTSTVAMAGTYLVGLAVTSGSTTGALNTSTFDNVTDGVAPPPAPAAPSGLTATAASSSQINLAWTNNATSQTGFKIERSSDNISYCEIADLGASATSFANTGLTASTTYFYRVRAYNIGGYSAYSNTASAATPVPTIPAAPTGLMAAAGNAQVTLNWTAAAGATSYNVKRATVSGGPYTTIGTAGYFATYTDTGLTNGTTYYYVVSAVNAGGESANSAQASAAPFVPVQFTGTVIGSPGSWSNSGNTIAKAFDNSLTTFYDALNATGDWAGLDFGAGASNIITQVNYCPRAGFAGRMVGGVFQGSNVADFTTGVVTLFTVTAAPADGVFTTKTLANTTGFRYARYLGPANGYCNVAEVQFSGQSGTPTIPPAPTGLTATAGNAQVSLSWTASSGAISYNVKRATVSGGPYTTVAAGVTATSYTNTGLTNGTVYYFVVSAVNAVGESANSTQVGATPTAGGVPPAPTGLTATLTGNDTDVSLNWTAATGATGYKVKRATVSGGPYTVIATPAASPYTDTAGKVEGTTYYYVVSATNAAGESANSTQVSVVP